MNNILKLELIKKLNSSSINQSGANDVDIYNSLALLTND